MYDFMLMSVRARGLLCVFVPLVTRMLVSLSDEKSNYGKSDFSS